MKENQNKLDIAIEMLKNQHIPLQPPKEVVDATAVRLAKETEGIILKRRPFWQGFKICVLVVCVAAVLILIHILPKKPAELLKTKPDSNTAIDNSEMMVEEENKEVVRKDDRPVAATKISDRDKKAEIMVEKSLESQLQLVKEFFKNGDVEGLLYALEDPREKVKVACAYYLAVLGDEDVATILEHLRKEWQGDPKKNPFAASLLLLRSRLNINHLTEPIETKTELNEPNDSATAEKKEAPAETNEPEQNSEVNNF